MYVTCLRVWVLVYGSVSACASGVLLWLCFGEVRCNVGEALAAPLSGWCQPVCLCTLPFFGPILPFKHLFAALTYPVKPLLPLCQQAGLTVLLTLQLQGCLHYYADPFLIVFCNVSETKVSILSFFKHFHTHTHNKFSIQVHFKCRVLHNSTC